MELTEVLRRRRMVRNYRPDPIPSEQLERVLEAALQAPSAGFTQGQSFVVVQDAGRREQIAEISGEPRYLSKGYPPWLTQAPVHVVCCTSEDAYHERYREPDKLLAGGIERSWPVPFWYVDAGCSLMLLLLAAVDEGLAAGFLGWDGEETQLIKELLDIPKEVMPIGLVTLGFPAPDRPSGSLQRGRKNRDAVIRRETY